MAFPTLFPYGKRDPTNPARRWAVKPTDGFRHLLQYFTYGVTGPRCYRFASHPRLSHWCQNMLERHRMLSQAQIYLKHSEGDAALTIQQLKAALQAGWAESLKLMERMYRHGANITRSNSYWFARTQELQAVFATKGCATLFFTLSAADNHWSDFHRLMPPGYENSSAGRRRTVIDNPPRLIRQTYTKRHSLAPE